MPLLMSCSATPSPAGVCRRRSRPDIQDNPVYAQDPEIYPGLDGKVRYEEGLFIGYRHYDKTGIAPLFPFGFGLSYTSFIWNGFKVTPQGDDFIVEISVTNTGSRAGSDVVQIYVEDPAPLLPRPVRELKGFAKLHLAPGQTGIARIKLTRRAFAVYDVAKQDWVTRQGSYILHAARNAGEMAARAEVTLSGA